MFKMNFFEGFHLNFYFISKNVDIFSVQHTF